MKNGTRIQYLYRGVEVWVQIHRYRNVIVQIQESRGTRTDTGVKKYSYYIYTHIL